jgi:hypothetical protein
MDHEQLPRAALIRLLDEHDASLRDAGKNGIVMSYTGRTAPWQIIRQVKPKPNKIVKKFSVGDQAAPSLNEIWDGENLSTMVSAASSRHAIPQQTASDSAAGVPLRGAIDCLKPSGCRSLPRRISPTLQVHAHPAG